LVPSLYLKPFSRYLHLNTECARTDGRTHTQTHISENSRLYPLVSPSSLGGYNNLTTLLLHNSTYLADYIAVWCLCASVRFVLFIKHQWSLSLQTMLLTPDILSTPRQLQKTTTDDDKSPAAADRGVASESQNFQRTNRLSLLGGFPFQCWIRI